VSVYNIYLFLNITYAANAINPLVAFYDIHGRRKEALFFYFVSDTTPVKNPLKMRRYRYILRTLRAEKAVFPFFPRAAGLYL
jgi:hypothetical protein